MRTRRPWAAPGVALAAAVAALLLFTVGGTMATAEDLLTDASASASLTGEPVSASATASPSQSLATEPPTGTDRYIVVAEPGAQSQAQTSVLEAGGDVVVTYSKAVVGMAADLTIEQAAALAEAPGIEYLEKDQPVSIGTNDTDPAIITDAGCATRTLTRGDDVSSGSVSLGFTVNWFGTAYTNIYVGSNGGIAFDDGAGGFTDYFHNVTTATRPIVLPLGTDVDARVSGTSAITYGPLSGTFGGRSGFCINWVNVGAFGKIGIAYSAQLLIMDRGSGNVDLIFNYAKIDSVLAPNRIEIGYADPVDRGNSLRVTGSADNPTQFGDTGSLARISNRLDGSPYTSVTGRYVFPITAGAAPTASPTSSASPTATATSSCPTSGPAGSQACAPWGLDRIDQGDLPLNSLYFAGGDGTGVKAYIVDTGIKATHTEFTGRLLTGVDEIGDGQGTNDCNGHGTHVAGTVGGTTYGAAKQVSLVPVRVMNCFGSGSTSSVLAGIDWAIADHVSGPAVMNLSLGGGFSKSLNDGIAAAFDDGIAVVVAAGNSTIDACEVSPASEPKAITVGATDQGDSFAYFSNYGSCVDILAPGVNILSAGISSNTAAATMSGTSMSSPHVAGAAAAYLSAHISATPAQVTAALLAVTSSNRVSSVPSGTPNELLYARDFTANSAHGTSLSSGSGGSSGGGSGGGSSGGSSDSGGGALQVITEVRPAVGPLTGGNSIAIIGYGFTGATKVQIGNKDASFTVVNDAHVEATVPPGDRIGPADVAVVLTPARGRAFAPGGYVYQQVVQVPVAPTTPDEVGILQDATPVALPALIRPVSRPSLRTIGGASSLSIALPRASAGLQATLMRGTKPVSKAVVGASGRVTFRAKKLAAGSYRIRVIDSAGAGHSTVPFIVRATRA